MAVEFFRSAEERKLLTILLIITFGEKAREFSKSKVYVKPGCNHEEADTRMILGATSKDTYAVVIAKDADVFLLLACAMQDCKSTNEWFMCIENEKFVYSEHYGKFLFQSLLYSATDLCSVIQLYTGTTLGKVRAMKKLARSEQQYALIEGISHYEILSQQLTQRHSCKR